LSYLKIHISKKHVMNMYTIFLPYSYKCKMVIT